MLNGVHVQVVFVSPFEHHSNLLPWRDIGAEAGDASMEPGLLISSRDSLAVSVFHSTGGLDSRGCRRECRHC